MKVLIVHGYLLRGTGSNIYNASLARALARLGHEVHLLCQERHWDAPDGVSIHNPEIGRVLPVYVADTYDGFDAKPYPDLTDAELDHYIEANVAAVRAAPTCDVALANHLVMNPVILARGLPDSTPFAIKVHGSALEYTVRPNRERFVPYALEGIRAAASVLVGSRHTAESLWEVLAAEPSLRERTRLGPPGVDVHAFCPGTADLDGLADRLESGEAATWGGERGAARDRGVRHLPRGARPVRRGAASPRHRGPARRRRARPGARGRPARGAEASGELPRQGGRRLARGGARRSRPGPTPRPARARRPPRAAARLRGPGDAQHLPGGFRDGRRRGGRVRGAAAVGRPLGDGGGDCNAGPRPAGGAAAAALVRGGPHGGGPDRREARDVARARPRPARTRQERPGRRSRPAPLVGERRGGGHRGRASG